MFAIIAKMHAFQCIMRKMNRENLNRRILPGCNCSLNVHQGGQLAGKHEACVKSEEDEISIARCASKHIHGHTQSFLTDNRTCHEQSALFA